MLPLSVALGPEAVIMELLYSGLAIEMSQMPPGMQVCVILPVGMGSGGGSGHIPLGFGSADEFAQFGSRLYAGLGKAGIDDVTAIFQGSSVTGKKFTTGAAFDVGRLSDFDIALASRTLLQRAKELGIELRSGGTRTGPLKAIDIERLGLTELRQQLSEQAGRPINFMIFDSVESAVGRSPGIIVP
jgi:filamentous hemagglutinin